MSAFGTKKPFGDRGVQLTFPANFQKAYDMGFSYFPSYEGSPMEVMVGQDFQANYHLAKRIDANQNVLNGIQARKTMEQKLLTGHQNYHLPKPVLGQRIYANPMNGAEIPSSTRRDNGANAPFRTVEVGQQVGSGTMRGGVVTSLEGQQFYQKQLQNRIAQLNRMNALAQGYAVQLGQSYKTDDNTKTGGFDKVEYFNYLRALMDALSIGDLTRFTFENMKDMISLFFKFAPTMTREDIQDTRDSLDVMLLILRDGLSEQAMYANFSDRNQAYAETLNLTVDMMRGVVNSVEANYGRPEKDMRTLVNSLRKTAGFEQLLKKSNDPLSLLKRLRQEAIVRGVDYANLFTRLEDFDDGDGRDGDDGFDDDDDDEDGDGDGRFNRPAVTREDAEQRGAPRQPFAGRDGDENREAFGRRTGIIVYGGAPRYFGEAEDEAERDAEQDQFPRYVAPLTLAGADPNAEGVPRANTTVLKDAVYDQVTRVLRPLGYTEDRDAEEFISMNYANPTGFVDEVADGLEERGFTPAQISEGMRRVGYEVFSDYISENAGETEPAPITASRASALLPMGGLAPPVYRDDDEDGQADVVPPAETGTNTRAEAERSAPADVFRTKQIPRSREEMYSSYGFNEAKYKALASRLGYKVRDGTELKNIKARIIKLVKAIDPSW